MATQKELETLRKLHEEIGTLPGPVVAALAKQCLMILGLDANEAVMADLDALTDEDPSI